MLNIWYVWFILQYIHKCQFMIISRDYVLLASINTICKYCQAWAKCMWGGAWALYLSFETG